MLDNQKTQNDLQKNKAQVLDIAKKVSIDSGSQSTTHNVSLNSDVNDEQNKSDSNKANIQYTTPDEFYPSQDPMPSREDITLGRNTSSATTISTAKAAPNSSEVSNDAKWKS